MVKLTLDIKASHLYWLKVQLELFKRVFKHDLFVKKPLGELVTFSSSCLAILKLLSAVRVGPAKACQAKFERNDRRAGASTGGCQKRHCVTCLRILCQ